VASRRMDVHSARVVGFVVTIWRVRSSPGGRTMSIRSASREATKTNG
jgi:hypothetical protein